MALSLRAGVRLAGRWKRASLGEYTNFALIAVKFGSAATENSCDLCKHHTLLEAANPIAVVVGDATAHEVRQRARCHNCGVKGSNTYQIVYTGNSDVAMDGAAKTKMNGQM